MYTPKPIDTSDVELSEELLSLTEKLAENTHDIWAKGRIAEGWTYGPVRDDKKKETPCLVPYSDLPESEKDYDRNTALETLKMILKLGFEIKEKPLTGVCRLSENEEENEIDFNSEEFLAELDALFGDSPDEQKTNSENDDELDNIIFLDDEDGRKHRFEFLDLIEYDGNEYVILMPAELCDEDEPGEVVILRVEESSTDDIENYESVDDEKILKAVFAIFRDKFQNEFDFSEYEDDN